MATVLVDVDGPVANLPEAWLLRYNQDYNDNLTVDQIDSWDMVKYVKPECGSAIYSYLDSHIYDFVKPVEGALVGVKELRAAGHRVIFVTSSPEGTGDAKYAWLKRHGFLDNSGAYGDGRVSDDYIEAHDKSQIRGDILIDDREENVANFPGNTILFDAPHNRSYGHGHRAKNWDDVLAIVYFGSKPAVASGVIAGVGADEPVDISPNGAKQSKLPYRFDLVDPTALFALANILAVGSEKYGEWNWRGLTTNSNLNHALTHIYAYLAGDTQDDHLGHAFCRLMFAFSKANNSDPLGLMTPPPHVKA